MIVIKNGVGRVVPFKYKDIMKEASQEGSTSIVEYKSDSATITISQHNSGTWDIYASVRNGRIYTSMDCEFDEENASLAVESFMKLVKNSCCGIRQH